MATILHDSDCAVHNEPAYPNGLCNCGANTLELAMTQRDKARSALEEAIEAIEGVEQDTVYQFEPDHTPKAECFVARLKAALLD